MSFLRPLSFLCGLLVLVICSCGPGRQEALQYHDRIVGYLNRIVTLHNHYQLMSEARTALSGPRSPESYALETGDSIKYYTKAIESVPALEKGAALKESAAALSRAYVRIYDDCVQAELQALRASSAGSDTGIRTRYEACNREVAEREKTFRRERRRFAEAYNIQVLL